MEKLLNEIYRQYLSLLGKTKELELNETAYFLELAGQVFEKEAFRSLSRKLPQKNPDIKNQPSEKV